MLDSAGNLYGTTQQGGLGYGIVYRLNKSTPGSSNWTLTVLYRFAGAADGARPDAGVTIGPQGKLYGTTNEGGNGCVGANNVFGGLPNGCGTVFELTPPAPGMTDWTKKTLYSFDGSAGKGGLPETQVILDAQGNVFGLAGFRSGVVFKLSPPKPGAIGWTFKKLAQIKSPPYGNYIKKEPNLGEGGGLVTLPDGSFQGTISLWQNWVGAFELHPKIPKAVAWITTAHDEAQSHLPTVPGLARDAAGNLYGAVGPNSGSGSVVKITPSPGGWTSSTLYSFNAAPYPVGDAAAPVVGPTVGADGNIYGTSYWGGLGNQQFCAGAINGCGAVYRIAP